MWSNILPLPVWAEGTVLSWVGNWYMATKLGGQNAINLGKNKIYLNSGSGMLINFGWVKFCIGLNEKMLVSVAYAAAMNIHVENYLCKLHFWYFCKFYIFSITTATKIINGHFWTVWNLTENIGDDAYFWGKLFKHKVKL